MQCNHGLVENGARLKFATMTSLAKVVMVKREYSSGYICGLLAEICMKAEQKNAKIRKDVLDYAKYG